MVRLERIGKRFGPQVLFENLSWMIPHDARIGLVGRNGAGKTTLFRIVAGLEEVDAGEVHRPSSLRIGYLPQEVETISHGTVLSVVLSGFEEVRALETRLEELERRMARAAPGDPELERLTRTYGETRHRFETLGGDRLEVRARAVLSGLGVPVSRFHRAVRELSGGWRMRVALARLLLTDPELLLLDEPTNHLDLPALDWLESFLVGYRGALVVVSHDRYLLNRIAIHVAELERGGLEQYPGNYDAYLAEKEVRRQAREQAARRQAREEARVRRFVERFRYKATKARQVQSRLRALEKTRKLEAPVRTRAVRFGFPPAPRSGALVARVESVRKAFGSTVVFRDANLRLRRGDRVALVGPNGSGKSTLLKMLAGRMIPEEGDVELGHNVQVRYYAQHQLEALDPARTVLQEAEREAPGTDRQRLRSFLGAFLFRGDEVEKKVAVLSGGEKARLALARLLLRPANLVLLDEPTNHLDLPSREVLEEALNEYDGTLMVVSHDRYFINRVATSVAVVGGGSLERFEGDYDTYLERCREAGVPDAAVPRAPAEEERRARRERSREARRQEAEERNRRYRERREMERRLGPIEAEIESLERRMGELDRRQADPGVYRDAARARELGRERAELQERLSRLYARWEEVAADLPSNG